MNPFIHIWIIQVKINIELCVTQSRTRFISLHVITTYTYRYLFKNWFTNLFSRSHTFIDNLSLILWITDYTSDRTYSFLFKCWKEEVVNRLILTNPLFNILLIRLFMLWLWPIWYQNIKRTPLRHKMGI